MDNDITLQAQVDRLRGELRGTQALVAGLANLLLTRQAFQSEGSARLQAARDAYLRMPVAEDHLAGIDALERWLRAL